MNKDEHQENTMGFAIKKDYDQTWEQRGDEIAEEHHVVLEFYELYEQYKDEGFDEKNSVIFALYDLHLIEKVEEDSEEDSEYDTEDL